MKDDKLKIVTTSELFTEEKKKKTKPIITTRDLTDEQIHKQDVEGKKDEKEE